MNRGARGARRPLALACGVLALLAGCTLVTPEPRRTPPGPAEVPTPRHAPPGEDRQPAPVDPPAGERPGVLDPPGGDPEPSAPPGAELRRDPAIPLTPTPPADPVTAEVDPREVRALWVVRTALVHPDSIRVMVSRAADAGFTTLLVQVRGRGDAFYLGGPEPRSTVLWAQPVDFDPLATVIREARARDLEVHAWVNTHLVASAVTLPTDPGHLLVRHPEWLAVPRVLARTLHDMDPADPRYVAALARYARENSSRVEGIYTSPTHPGVLEHMVSVWRNLLASYELDGVHMDYVRYPSGDFDHSRATMAAFRDHLLPAVPPARAAELDRQARSNPLVWTEAFPREFDTFRRDGVTRLVSAVAEQARAMRPGIRISAAVFPGVTDARDHRFQDWPAWVRDGVVDAVAPMAYTNHLGRFREQIREAVAAAGGFRVWAGVGIYQTTLPGAITKAGIAREEGAAGVVLFSYDWAVGEGSRSGSGAYLDRFSSEVFMGR